MRADIEITQFSKNYKLTQIKSTLLVLFALGVFERLLLAGETPMVREKSKNSHIDCRGSGCTAEEVDKIRKVKMEGKRGQRPKKNAFSKASANKYEGKYRSALKRSTALKHAKIGAQYHAQARKI